MIQIYPKQLETYIRFHNKYIPRKIQSKEKLIQYHRYWIAEVDGIYKLTKIEEYFHNLYYFFEGKDSGQLYTYPLDGNIFYELQINTEDILSKNIINDDNKYKGSEIKFWFYKKWNKKYIEFERYIDINSEKSIQDDRIYKLYGELIEGQYQNCKVLNRTPRE